MGNSHSRVPVQSHRKELLSYEKPWVDLQSFLLRRGYKLRPRYQPTWKPSWKRFGDFGGSRFNREDGIYLKTPNLLDATRISDGLKVAIKMVPTNSDELPILQKLNSPHMRADPRNKTVAVFDIILMPQTDDTALVVMPMLMDFAVVPFHFVSELCEAFSQFLLGLAFLHDHNIAHRDACFFNLMMDSRKVVPKCFHFVKPKESAHTRRKPIEYVDRRSVAPVDYCLIDFGVSIAFPLEWARDDCEVLGIVGQGLTVPGMSNTVFYNPFQSDVYQLGNVLKKVVEGYEGVEVFGSLCTRMTSVKPKRRPTAQEAYNLFIEIVSALSDDELDRRIWYKKSTPDLRHRVEFGHENPPELLDFEDFIDLYSS